MEAWGLTDTGNVREENQDFYRMERLGPETLLAVCATAWAARVPGMWPAALPARSSAARSAAPARRDDRGGGAGRAVHGGKAGQYFCL